MKRCRPWRGGLKGLTGVGDWGEEVVERRKVGFDDEEVQEVEEGGFDELVMSEDEDTERGSEVGSEDTTKPVRVRGRGRKGLDVTGRGGGLWAEESFDESVYNTAEGEDEGSDDDRKGR